MHLLSSTYAYIPDEYIWNLYITVNTWHVWDTSIRNAYMKGEFAMHSRGILITEGGFKKYFEVIDFKYGQCYTLHIKSILGKIEYRREIKRTEHGALITHAVKFKGIRSFIFGNMTRKIYRKQLHQSVRKVKYMAEENYIRTFSKKAATRPV